MGKAEGKTREKKEKVIKALAGKALGSIIVACKMVGVSRQTHYDWANSDEDYKRRAKEAIDNPAHNRVLIEMALAGLRKNLNKGYYPAVRDVLKNFEVANYTNEKKVKVESELPFVGFGLDFDDDTE